MLPQNPLEAGKVRGLEMRALYQLRQLPGVAHEDDVPRRAPHRRHVGKSHLPRVVDKQPVEPLDILIRGEEKDRSTDDPAIRLRDCILVHQSDGAGCGTAIIIAFLPHRDFFK